MLEGHVPAPISLSGLRCQLYAPQQGFRASAALRRASEEQRKEPPSPSSQQQFDPQQADPRPEQEAWSPGPRYPTVCSTLCLSLYAACRVNGALASSSCYSANATIHHGAGGAPAHTAGFLCKSAVVVSVCVSLKALLEKPRVSLVVLLCCFLYEVGYLRPVGLQVTIWTEPSLISLSSNGEGALGIPFLGRRGKDFTGEGEMSAVSRPWDMSAHSEQLAEPRLLCVVVMFPHCTNAFS